MNTAIQIPTKVLENMKWAYGNDFVPRNKVVILNFFLRGEISLFLDHFVPHFYDEKMIYEIARKLYRNKRIKIPDEELVRLRMVRDSLQEKIRNMKRFLRNEISTMNRFVSDCYDQDRIEKDNRIQNARNGIICNVKYGSFDGNILSTIFGFLHHKHIFRCRSVCNGFYDTYLVSKPNFFLYSNYLRVHIRDGSFHQMIIMTKDKGIKSAKNIITTIEKLRIVKSYYPAFKYLDHLSFCIAKFVRELDFTIDYYDSREPHYGKLKLVPKQLNMLFIGKNVITNRSMMKWNNIDIMKPKILVIYMKHINILDTIITLESVKVIYIVDNSYKDDSSARKVFASMPDICSMFPNLRAICITENQYSKPAILETKSYFPKQNIYICTGRGKYYPRQ